MTNLPLKVLKRLWLCMYTKADTFLQWIEIGWKELDVNFKVPHSKRIGAVG